MTKRGWSCHLIRTCVCHTFPLRDKHKVTKEASHREKQLSSAVIVGTVYCDTCFLQDFSRASHFIAGGTVAVACKGTGLGPSFHEEVKTDKHGEFRVNLPSYVSKHLKRIKGCSVKLVRSSEPYCAVASTATSSSLHLKSIKKGIHIYSAGFFTFKPLKQPQACSQNPSIANPKNLNFAKSFIDKHNDPTFAPSIEDPPMPILPPVDQKQFPRLPQLPKLPPLPQLPPLPSLPGLPFFPPVLNIPTPGGSISTTQPSEKNYPSLPKRSPPPSLPRFPSIPPEKKNPTPKGSSGKPQPSDGKIEEKQFLTPFRPLPPDPFRPPSILLPILPSPPPSILPPIFPSPPSPPFVSFPPVPGLIPSPPSLPFPLPPFPFQPSPGFPGVPPSATTNTIPSSKETSP